MTTLAEFLEAHGLAPLDPSCRALRPRTVAHAAHVRLAALEAEAEAARGTPTPRRTKGWSFRAFGLRAEDRGGVGRIERALAEMPRAKGHPIGAKAFADLLVMPSASRIGNRYIDVGFEPFARTRRFQAQRPQARGGRAEMAALVEDVGTLSDIAAREPSIPEPLLAAIAILPQDDLRPAALEFSSGGGRGTLLRDLHPAALTRMATWWETAVLDLAAAHHRPHSHTLQIAAGPVEAIMLAGPASSTLATAKRLGRGRARARILAFLEEVGDAGDVAARIPE